MGAAGRRCGTTGGGAVVIRENITSVASELYLPIELHFCKSMCVTILKIKHMEAQTIDM